MRDDCGSVALPAGPVVFPAAWVALADAACGEKGTGPVNPGIVAAGKIDLRQKTMCPSRAWALRTRWRTRFGRRGPLRWCTRCRRPARPSWAQRHTCGPRERQ